MNMKNIAYLLTAISMTAVVIAGCNNWESTDGFNTSGGAGASVNLSGVYKPRSGGYLVGSNITYLIMNHIGDTVEVRDNNNSYYLGSIGSPAIQAAGVNGTYPAGAVILQSQINFAGQNLMSTSDVSFAGIIRAVAVDDVKTYSTNIVVAPIDPEITTTITRDFTYTLTEANTQYILEGNWVEGAAVSYINAIAPGAGGTFTTSSSSSTNSP